MVATRSKKKAGKVPAEQPVKSKPISQSAACLLAACGGILLGLSAPGFDQHYVAWFGLVPFLLLSVAAKNLKLAFVRGLSFGMGYNLVYLNWYLNLHPMYWLGYNFAVSLTLAVCAWLLVAAHQAVIMALVAVVIRAIPLSGGFLPRRVEGNLTLPSLVVVPILYVLIVNKLGNAHDLLGVPWTVLEYSQYKQPAMLQITSWIGGIGLGAVIVMANTAIAGFIATAWQRLNLKKLAAETFSQSLSQLFAAALIVVCMLAFGYSRLNSPLHANEPLSVVQGNINIEMEKRKHSYSLAELMQLYGGLLSKAPAGLCIWTESALPTYLKEEKELLLQLANSCTTNKRNMVIGAMDKNADGPFNSAFGIDSNGKLASAVYHKRYLVPFGEYMPAFAKLMPEQVQLLTNTPAGSGFNAGKFPVVLDLSGNKVAPLICFETLSPELVASSVRNGGEILVNISDLAWFHESMCGDQMLAFSVLRAVETNRYFVFAANTGPSAIIDSCGRITARSPSGKAMTLTGKVRANDGFTPFVQWIN